MRKIIVILGLAVFACVACALVYTTYFYHPEVHLEGKLEEKLLSELPGWQVEDLDLAASEEMQERVAQILNYTQALFRSYTRGDVQVGVYIGYWAPKMMPVRQVQAHTPDICWVRNGWDVADSEFAVAFQSQGEPLRPAEVRQMHKQGHVQYVAYWHIIGERTYVNRSVGTWDRLDPIKSLFRFGLHQQEEQFFIRVSSNRPLQEIWNDPDFQQIIEPLKELALHLPLPDTETVTVTTKAVAEAGIKSATELKLAATAAL